MLYSNLEEFSRMSRMVSDMLFLAQADNNQLIPEQQALDLAEDAGVARMVLNIHHLGQQIRDHIAGQDIVVSDESDLLLETGGGLRKALPLLVRDHKDKLGRFGGAEAVAKLDPKTAVIERIDAAPGIKIAVDVPSGLSADTPDVIGPAIRASLTVTLGAPNLLTPRPEGLYCPPGDFYIDPLRPVAHVRASGVEIGSDRLLSNLSQSAGREIGRAHV